MTVNPLLDQAPDGAIKRKFGGVQIQKPSEIKETGECLALYGVAGSGKTTLAATATRSALGSPLLYVDVEGGVRAIRHLDDVDVLEVGSWSELESIRREIKLQRHDYKCIVFDNMSEMQAMNMKHIVGNETPQIQHWGKSTADLLAFTREMRDLTSRSDLNVILIAWDYPEKEESTGIVKRQIGFTPSLAEKFPGIINTVGHITIKNNPPFYTRMLGFAPGPRTDAKLRRSQIDSAMSIPLEIPFGLDQPLMADLLEALRGVKPFPVDKYVLPKRA
jgi:hypothetical protein